MERLRQPIGKCYSGRVAVFFFFFVIAITNLHHGTQNNSRAAELVESVVHQKPPSAEWDAMGKWLLSLGVSYDFAALTSKLIAADKDAFADFVWALLSFTGTYFLLRSFPFFVSKLL